MWSVLDAPHARPRLGLALHLPGASDSPALELLLTRRCPCRASEASASGRAAAVDQGPRRTHHVRLERPGRKQTSRVGARFLISLNSGSTGSWGWWASESRLLLHLKPLGARPLQQTGGGENGGPLPPLQTFNLLACHCPQGTIPGAQGPATISSWDPGGMSSGP